MSMLITIASRFLSTLGLLPPQDLFPASDQQIQTGDSIPVCCGFTMNPLPTTARTIFNTQKCSVYGYPSTGGVLIRESASLLDMLFLSVPRGRASQRSPSADEEDIFCNLMRRIGAKFWSSRDDWLEVKVGEREITEEEKKVVVFGWPTDGVGVWVLRFQSKEQMPKDIGILHFAMDMEEKIQMMREFGATYVENVTQVEELS